MSQQELLKIVVEVLDSCSIAYMVTGSFASGLWGEPRSTHDIELVTEISKDVIDELLSQFPLPRYFLQQSSIEAAVTRRTMFNLLDLDEGDKVDFWMVTDEPFDQSRFSRRIRKMINGLPVWVSTPENTILAKLRWCKLSGGSEKQFTDALRVYEVQQGAIDNAYLNEWAAQLEVTDLWDRLQNSAGDIGPR